MRKDKKKKVLIILSFIVCLMISIVLHGLWCNKALTVTEINIESNQLPSSFNGFKIAHISDLHNEEFGKENVHLISMLENCMPDIIVITGDIIDSYDTNIDVSLKFVKKAIEIAPCYYVSGNHESRIEDFKDMESKMEGMGVIVLKNESTTIQKGEDRITIAGLEDPAFYETYLLEEESNVENKLKETLKKREEFVLLLSHRPELFEMYVKEDVDVIFSGHAHGGQIILPLIGALFAPNQGLFPTYTSGVYSENNTNLVVSRGLGNSLIPLRINNCPEIVLVTLN